MRAAATIAWRDFRSAHGLPATWFFHGGFLLFSGILFTWLVANFSDTSALAQMNARSAPDLAGQLNIDVGVVQPLVQRLAMLFVVVVPLLTMGLVAEDRKTGAMELLLTAPVSSGSLVLGKFLGGMLTAGVTLLFTLWFPLALLLVARPELGTLFSGWFGLVLVLCLFTAVGLLASSLTSSPLLSSFLSFATLAGLSVAGAFADGSPTNLGAALAAASPLRRLAPLATGVIDTGSVCFFLLGTIAALFLTERFLEWGRGR